ncbi:Radial spoke head protein 9-like protein [Trichoplax sp. H2]|nr:Radial spoke head protein 9-like protein [Trichoplax sp. H2]|eukprot:RDD44841.1 Radial spoke head protein 9-like protein [Trichoplax sp. H2]
MDSATLHLDIDYVGSSGILLSTEQKTALQNSLLILKHQNKFKKVVFWGKITGCSKDYFVAQGVGNDEMKDKKTFYSLDCSKWALLPIATDELKILCSRIKGRFAGDPSYEYEHVEIRKVPGENGEENEEETTIAIREEERLAVTIDAIDRDVKIVPRGAYVKLPTGEIQSNPSFEGLSTSNAAKLTSYFHFDKSASLNKRNLMQKASFDKSLDFLGDISEDVPKGSWSVQFERGDAVVTIRSLLWIGYVFYHIPDTRSYGHVYVGNGEINLDLSFML